MRMALFGYPACAKASGAVKEQQSAAMTSPTRRSMAFSLRARPQHGFVASLGCRRLAAQAQFDARIEPLRRSVTARKTGPRNRPKPLTTRVVRVGAGPYVSGSGKSSGPKSCPRVKEFPMVATAAADVAPATIEVT